jgi:hypothetical protein
MNLAPGPQAQVNIVRHALAGYHDRQSLVILYNSFAEVDDFELPPIKDFASYAAARAAVNRLLARLLEMYGDEVK